MTQLFSLTPSLHPDCARLIPLLLTFNWPPACNLISMPHVECALSGSLPATGSTGRLAHKLILVSIRRHQSHLHIRSSLCAIHIRLEEENRFKLRFGGVNRRSSFSLLTHHHIFKHLRFSGWPLRRTNADFAQNQKNGTSSLQRRILDAIKSTRPDQLLFCTISLVQPRHKDRTLTDVESTLSRRVPGAHPHHLHSHNLHVSCCCLAMYPLCICTL
ncbi:unnamed protein product [Protopolystoma xenopodis]|uniref:Uncharacterized protein n=1 Tax=Protopolystoma xenopodis TaxID=117903 RepID=A0A3S5AN33_9PLAT|nr:unnamed protein product [Protopolystoma xenopodis]